MVKKNFFKIYYNNYEYVKRSTILHSVFHRILDFKAGLDFYPAPYYKPTQTFVNKNKWNEIVMFN